MTTHTSDFLIPKNAARIVGLLRRTIGGSQELLAMTRRSWLACSFTSVTLVFVSIFFILPIAYSDTITLKDGKELKGIVVEDYKNRIIFSTPDGEVTVMKTDIMELVFDSEEDNLIKLGEQAREHREFAKAYAYYEKALKTNPDSKIAKDGLVFCHGYLFRKEEVMKQDDISRRSDAEQYGGALGLHKSEEQKFAEQVEKFKRTVGMALVMRENEPVISDVRPDSPAAASGVKKGDKLVSIWSRLTGYMSLEEVMAVLSDKPTLEIKCAIERTVPLGLNPGRGMLSKINDVIGATLSMEFDGLTVSSVKDGEYAAQAGLKPDDLITAIGGQSTRYMPLKKAVEVIKSAKTDSIALTIRREVVIWRVDTK